MTSDHIGGEMTLPAGNAIIAQSGGPTVVINASLAGVVEAIQESGLAGSIFGARHAVRGMLEGHLCDLGQLDQDSLNKIALTPGATLGSSRDKPDEDYCRKIFEQLSTRDIRYFFYIGGNDSADTCRIISEVSQNAGYELRAFHVPKTIDNDLVLNDHTPGFGSAAKFVACALMGDSLDNKALPGIKIDVIMGRHAGFLTAASALARTEHGTGPNLIYLPESIFDIDRFITDVDRVYSKEGRCMIAVSEGIHNAEGTSITQMLAEQLSGSVERDAHGNVQLSGSGALGDYLARLIRERLGSKLRVRADTFGYLQRSFADCVSASDRTEARESGRAAVQAALDDHIGASLTIRRTSDHPYTVEYVPVPLQEVARKTKVMPASWIKDGCDVTEDFIEYAKPLVGPLPVIGSI
ncbi:6-phosphofructokinase [bacterium]|nr:6-phosphofructokinase [bacterium]MDC0648194.1 6-phosphofructokinase [bacterium]